MQKYIFALKSNEFIPYIKNNNYNALEYVLKKVSEYDSGLEYLALGRISGYPMFMLSSNSRFYQQDIMLYDYIKPIIAELGFSEFTIIKYTSTAKQIRYDIKINSPNFNLKLQTFIRSAKIKNMLLEY